MMANYIADNAYMLVKPEATPGTPVIPTILIPIISESVKTVVNHEADRRMRGIDWKSMEVIRGDRQHEGDIEALCDPDSLGHIMNMIMTKGSTTGNGTDGYTHPFTVGAPKSYTFEFKRGLYAQRFFGVYADQVVLGDENRSLKATLSIKAMGQFSVASVGVALTGAGMTTLTLDDNYDLNPNRGLVVGDVLAIELTAGGYVNVTLTSVAANGRDVGFASTSITSAVGKSVYLVPQTVSQPTLQDPLYIGNLLPGFGATASAAATNATQALSTPIYDVEITIKNNLFSQNGSNRIDPVTIFPRTREAQIKLKSLFTGVLQRQKWMERVKQAIVLDFMGKYIKTDFTTQEKLRLTFNNVVLIDDDNALEVGEAIFDDETFEALYDTGDAAAMSASLINRSAGTVY